MTTNVTIRMDDELLRKVRHRAVDAKVSASQWIAKVLQDATAPESSREDTVRRRALRRLERGFRLGGRPLDRGQAHER
jgi:predicted transcriptional regulator